MANWSDLPEDLLILILSKLESTSDYVCFGSICSHWRFVLLEHRSHPRYQIPGIIFTFSNNRINISDAKYGFLPLSRSQAEYPYQSQPPHDLCSLPLLTAEAHQNNGFGSHQGWLVMCEYCPSYPLRAHVMNPITGAKFALPHLTTLPRYYDWKFTVSVHKAVLSSSPSGNSAALPLPFPCYVLVLYSTSMKEFRRIDGRTVISATFCEIGDENWRHIIDDHDKNIYKDAVFCKGQFYLVDFSARLYSFDVNATSPKIVEIASPLWMGEAVPASPVDSELLYLAELEEELVMITSRSGVSPELRVHKLDFREGNWIVLESLGEYALFVGFNQSSSLSASDVKGIRGNCIYFMERPDSSSATIFSLESSTTESLYFQYGRSWNGMWFTPSPWNLGTRGKPENTQKQIGVVADEVIEDEGASSRDQINEIEKIKSVVAKRRRRRNKNKIDEKKEEAKVHLRADQEENLMPEHVDQTITRNRSNVIEKFIPANSNVKRKEEEKEDGDQEDKSDEYDDKVGLRVDRKEQFMLALHDGTSSSCDERNDIEKLEHVLSNKIMMKTQKYMDKKYRKREKYG